MPFTHDGPELEKSLEPQEAARGSGLRRTADKIDETPPLKALTLLLGALTLAILSSLV